MPDYRGRKNLPSISPQQAGRVLAPGEKQQRALILGSFGVTYFVWGSTFVANAWASEHIPAFLLAGVRFTIASVILLAIARVVSPLKATRQQLVNSAIIGFLMFTVGNGLAVWSLKYIDSGISAIIIALQPLVVVLMEWLWHGKRPNIATVLGVFLGVAGIGLLVGQPAFQTGVGPVLGLIALLIALVCWGATTVWIPVADLPKGMLERTALQMAFGSVFLLVASLCMGDFGAVDLASVTAQAWWSLGYLIVFGSLLAMTAFNFLLSTVEPSKVVTNTYVNPVIAVFLGWWLRDEAVTSITLVASGLLLTGVFMIVHNRKRRSRPTGDDQGEVTHPPTVEPTKPPDSSIPYSATTASDQSA